jgi:hypothetical protein
MFGTKRITEAYEARIADIQRSHAAEVRALLSHIESLKALVFVPHNTSNIPEAQLEADAILSVRENVIELTEEELKRRAEEESERSRILGGNY